jgi:hypothetical protein
MKKQQKDPAIVSILWYYWFQKIELLIKVSDSGIQVRFIGFQDVFWRASSALSSLQLVRSPCNEVYFVCSSA